jgi:periplasmic protein TonB
MRKIVILLLLVSANLLGQDSKKVIVETSNSKEVYYVLENDKNIRHGEYLRYSWNKDIAEKGLYQMNQRVGAWEFYDFNGNLEQRYNYTDKKIEFSKPSELKPKMWTEINGNYEEKLPDELPIFIGGQARQNYCMLTLKYPADARRKGIQGKVIISAIITRDGQLIDEKIESGIGFGCDEEALWSIMNIPDEWIPGKVSGEATNIKILIPVTFKLG